MNVQTRLQPITCPCCGGFLGEAAPIEAMRAHFSDGEFKAIKALASSGETGLTPGDLAFKLHHKDDTATRQKMRILICALRRKVEKFGYYIPGGTRGRIAVYRLLPVEAGQ